MKRIAIIDNQIIRFTKILKAMLKKIEKPRTYKQIKEIVGDFYFCWKAIFLHLLEEALKRRWIIDDTYEITFIKPIREGYRLGIINSDQWILMLPEIQAYRYYCYKELEMKIYRKLPLYLPAMISDIQLWKDDTVDHELAKLRKHL